MKHIHLYAIINLNVSRLKMPDIHRGCDLGQEEATS